MNAFKEQGTEPLTRQMVRRFELDQGISTGLQAWVKTKPAIAIRSPLGVTRSFVGDGSGVLRKPRHDERRILTGKRSGPA